MLNISYSRFVLKLVVGYSCLKFDSSKKSLTDLTEFMGINISTSPYSRWLLLPYAINDNASPFIYAYFILLDSI